MGLHVDGNTIGEVLVQYVHVPVEAICESRQSAVGFSEN